MHALEQALAQKLDRRHAEQAFGRRRAKLHRAVAAMTHHHIAHVTGEQTITLFFLRQQHAAHPRDKLRADRKAGGVKRGRNHTKAHQRRVGRGVERRMRSKAVVVEHNEQQRGTDRQGRAKPTTRREPLSAASSGISTSQTTAND